MVKDVPFMSTQEKEKLRSLEGAGVNSCLFVEQPWPRPRGMTLDIAIMNNNISLSKITLSWSMVHLHIFFSLQCCGSNNPQHCPSSWR